MAQSQENPTNDNVQNTNRKKSSNVWGVAHTLILLLGPLLNGMAINAVGNEQYIRTNFAVLHGYASTNATPEALPSSIWSLGFLFPFGGLFGSIIGGIAVDKLGRKYTSLGFSIVIILGAVFKIASAQTHIALLFVGRFLDGLGSSGIMVSGLLLLFECLPETICKYTKPFVQIGINFGILMIGILLMNRISAENWNMAYISVVILGVILCIAIIFHTESPKYIYSYTKDIKATERYLKRLRKDSYDPKELDEIKKSDEQYANVKQLGIIELLRERKYLLCNISLIFLHISQQLSGINAIVSFSPALLKNAGLDNPDINAVIVISIGLGCSFIFAPLVGNKKRKVLWQIGFIFLFISTVGFLLNQNFSGPNQLSVFMLSLYVGMFQIGPGPVVWFISLEMYPNNAVGAAQSVASFFNWLANTIVFFITPILLTSIGIYTLIIFAVVQILVIIYSVFFVVETYGRSIDEIQADYGKIQSKFLPFNSALKSNASYSKDVDL